MFLQMEIVLLILEQIHRWPNGAYINNDYISLEIL